MLHAGQQPGRLADNEMKAARETCGKGVFKFSELTMQERYIIEMVRYIGFGEVKVTIQDGTPVRIDEYRRSIKL